MFRELDVTDHLYTLLYSPLSWRLILITFLVLAVPKIARLVIPLLISLRHHRQRKVLAGQIQVMKEELSGISQVNEFAKYSRVQRKMRVLVDQYTSITRDDAKLGFEYTLIAQIVIYLIAGLLGLGLAYQFVRMLI